MSDKDDFAALLDASFSEAESASSKRLKQGARVEGKVIQIGKDTVFVDVGTRSEGTIDRHQLEDADGNLTVKVGDTIRAVVQNGGDRPKLAIRIGGKVGADLDALESAMAAKTPVEGTVTKAVKAGLEIDISGHRCFCPASQIDRIYTEDTSVYEGQSMTVLILEIRDKGRSIVVSRRALLEAERANAAAELASKLEAGAVMEGTVSSVKKYGAFVDLGGIEGLIHISELAHSRVGSVADVVQVGENVTVKILEIDRREDPPKLRLSMKALTQAPKRERKEQKISDAKVTKVESYGIIVELEGGGSGVVPLRELDTPPGSDPRRRYPPGKEVRVVGIGTDNQGRPRYSIRRVEEAEARQNFREFSKAAAAEEKAAGGLGSLGDLLKARLGE
jgi:small subunit ribosomal protein S1